MLSFLQNNPCTFNVDDTSVKTVKMKWEAVSYKLVNHDFTLTTTGIHPDVVMSSFRNSADNTEVQLLNGDTDMFFEFTLQVDSNVVGILNEYTDYTITATLVEK